MSPSGNTGEPGLKGDNAECRTGLDVGVEPTVAARGEACRGGKVYSYLILSMVYICFHEVDATLPTVFILNLFLPVCSLPFHAEFVASLVMKCFSRVFASSDCTGGISDVNRAPPSLRNTSRS